MKPGMSGLWQVSGRSSLSWEGAIRLDLSYVENWSIVGDLLIMWQTARAVAAPGGYAHCRVRGSSIDKRQRGHGRLRVCPEAPGRQLPRFSQSIECTVKDEACR